jgi:hypothetical protein
MKVVISSISKLRPRVAQRRQRWCYRDNIKATIRTPIKAGVWDTQTSVILTLRRRYQDYDLETHQDWSLGRVKAVTLSISRLCHGQHNSNNLEATSRPESSEPVKGCATTTILTLRPRH